MEVLGQWLGGWGEYTAGVDDAWSSKIGEMGRKDVKPNIRPHQFSLPRVSYRLWHSHDSHNAFRKGYPRSIIQYCQFNLD